MNIAVCDKEHKVFELVQQYFAKFELAEQIRHIDYFEDVESMLISLKENAYDLFLLGVSLVGIHKISHVIYIREKGGRPVSYDDFRKQMIYAWNVFYHEDEPYIGRFHGKIVKLELNDIYYFESGQRATYVWTNRKKHRVNGTLNYEYKKLPEYRFARISQGMLVNLQHVTNIEKDIIYLENDMVVYSSVRRIQETNEKWCKYNKIVKIWQKSTILQRKATILHR